MESIETQMIRILGLKIANLEVEVARLTAMVQVQQEAQEGADDIVEDTVQD